MYGYSTNFNQRIRHNEDYSYERDQGARSPENDEYNRLDSRKRAFISMRSLCIPKNRINHNGLLIPPKSLAGYYKMVHSFSNHGKPISVIGGFVRHKPFKVIIAKPRRVDRDWRSGAELLEGDKGGGKKLKTGFVNFNEGVNSEARDGDKRGEEAGEHPEGRNSTKEQGSRISDLKKVSKIDEELQKRGDFILESKGVRKIRRYSQSNDEEIDELQDISFGQFGILECGQDYFNYMLKSKGMEPLGASDGDSSKKTNKSSINKISKANLVSEVRVGDPISTKTAENPSGGVRREKSFEEPASLYEGLGSSNLDLMQLLDTKGGRHGAKNNKKAPNRARSTQGLNPSKNVISLLSPGSRNSRADFSNQNSSKSLSLIDVYSRQNKQVKKLIMESEQNFAKIEPNEKDLGVQKRPLETSDRSAGSSMGAGVVKAQTHLDLVQMVGEDSPPSPAYLQGRIDEVEAAGRLAGGRVRPELLDVESSDFKRKTYERYLQHLQKRQEEEEQSRLEAEKEVIRGSRFIISEKFSKKFGRVPSKENSTKGHLSTGGNDSEGFDKKIVTKHSKKTKMLGNGFSRVGRQEQSFLKKRDIREVHRDTFNLLEVPRPQHGAPKIANFSGNQRPNLVQEKLPNCQIFNNNHSLKGLKTQKQPKMSSEVGRDDQSNVWVLAPAKAPLTLLKSLNLQIDDNNLLYLAQPSQMSRLLDPKTKNLNKPKLEQEDRDMGLGAKEQPRLDLLAAGRDLQREERPQKNMKKAEIIKTDTIDSHRQRSLIGAHRGSEQAFSAPGIDHNIEERKFQKNHLFLGNRQTRSHQQEGASLGATRHQERSPGQKMREKLISLQKNRKINSPKSRLKHPQNVNFKDQRQETDQVEGSTPQETPKSTKRIQKLKNSIFAKLGQLVDINDSPRARANQREQEETNFFKTCSFINQYLIEVAGHSNLKLEDLRKIYASCGNNQSRFIKLFLDIGNQIESSHQKQVQGLGDQEPKNGLQE